jgi:predicted amidohydrolase
MERPARLLRQASTGDRRSRSASKLVAQANAIANQCYFIDVNGAGGLGVGKSQIIGPEGDIIHVAGGTRRDYGVSRQYGKSKGSAPQRNRRYGTGSEDV